MIDRILLFFTALFLGGLLVSLHLPIPFLLGGLVTSLLYKTFASGGVSWPKKWREYGLMIAGYGIGSNFNVAAWQNFLKEIVGITESTAVIMAVSFVIAVITARMTKADLQSCVMGMLPGGITMTMLLAEEDKRVNPNIVAVMQIMRLLGVVISVPFLVILLLNARVGSIVPPVNPQATHWLILLPLTILGGFVAKKIHMPTAAFLGSIIATSIFSISVNSVQSVPFWLMSPAQVSIGLFMGMQLDSASLSKTKRILPFVFLGTAVLVTVSVFMANFLAVRYNFSLATAFLALAPGGIAEMALAGMSMGEDVSIILVYQMVRLLAINIFVPPLLKAYFGKAPN